MNILKRATELYEASVLHHPHSIVPYRRPSRPAGRMEDKKMVVRTGRHEDRKG